MLSVQRNCVFALVLSTGFSGAATAQDQIAEQDGLGIELEELLSEKGTFRLEMGATLAALRQSGVSGLYETIRTGAGNFVSVPIDVGTTQRQAENVIGSVGLRYGLTTKSEIYTRATLRYSQSRFTDTATGIVENLSESSLQSVIVGMNYRFVDEGEYPGVIGFADIAIAENTAAQGMNFQSGKSGTLGFSAFRVLDPVVLSLTAGYRANAPRTVDGNKINPGDTLFINPSIGFAVNNELTMTSGFGLDFTSADTQNGATIGTSRTNADLQFGLAYAWDKNTTLRADARSEVLGERSFTAGITLTRKLGQD